MRPHHARIPIAGVLGIVALLVLISTADVAARVVVDPSARPEAPARTTERELRDGSRLVVTWYRAWNGKRRALQVVVPPTHDARDPLPLVILARPAGGGAECATRLGGLPARYGFAVACIDGQGVHSRGHSFGAPGQVADLSRVPRFVRQRVVGLRIDPSRVFLAGMSLGATESLLVALRYPNRVRRVVALDPTTDMAARYRQSETATQRRQLMRAECGGPPVLVPSCFRNRSPIGWVERARPGPRIAIWYSVRDPVAAIPEQVPAFLTRAASARVGERIVVRTGRWRHGVLWNRRALHTAWLADFGLVPRDDAARVPLLRRG